MADEFSLISRFLRHFEGQGAPHVALGPGDDCAILHAPSGSELCVTTDALVEGVHFDPATFTAEEIGHKALAINLSDLAAMGAAPAWFLCSIAIPKEAVRRAGFVDGLARGMARLASRCGAALAGGNFSSARELSIHITAAGHLRKGRALRRDGARPGDLLFVTGTLGEAALALSLPKLPAATNVLGRRQRLPEPKLLAGELALAAGASAALDLSDGLLQDLSHVSEASGVALVLDSSAIPTSAPFREAGGTLRHALAGGEDYELALSVPAARCASLKRRFHAAGEPLTEIGWVESGRGVTIDGRSAAHFLAKLGGGEPTSRGCGFDHFR